MVMDENVPIVTDYYDHNRLKIKGLYTENVEGIHIIKNHFEISTNIWKYIVDLYIFFQNFCFCAEKPNQYFHEF